MEAFILEYTMEQRFSCACWREPHKPLFASRRNLHREFAVIPTLKERRRELHDTIR